LPSYSFNLFATSEKPENLHSQSSHLCFLFGTPTSLFISGFLENTGQVFGFKWIHFASYYKYQLTKKMGKNYLLQ
jgi:hypothetical protein